MRAWLVVFLLSTACGSGERAGASAASSSAASDASSSASAGGGGSTTTSASSASHAASASSSAASSGSSGAGGASEARVAPEFDGATGYVEIPDADAFSQPTTGEITVEAWMCPDSLDMPNREGSGYVHWFGKGEPDQQEWVARIYQQGNTEGRDNRISFYAFNLSGGLGAGSYFQDTLMPYVWIHYVGEIDATNTTIFRDGVQRDTDPLSGYSITPTNGSAPERIATRDLASFFQGSIARVAIYSKKLDAAAVLAHHDARVGGNYDAMVLAEPSLVGFWRLDETSGDVAHDALGQHDGTYHGGVTLGGSSW